MCSVCQHCCSGMRPYVTTKQPALRRTSKLLPRPARRRHAAPVLLTIGRLVLAGRGRAARGSAAGLGPK